MEKGSWETFIDTCREGWEDVRDSEREMIKKQSGSLSHCAGITSVRYYSAPAGIISKTTRSTNSGDKPKKINLLTSKQTFTILKYVT